MPNPEEPANVRPLGVAHEFPTVFESPNDVQIACLKGDGLPGGLLDFGLGGCLVSLPNSYCIYVGPEPQGRGVIIKPVAFRQQVGAKAYGNRGLVYLRKGSIDRALQHFDQAIRLDPGDAKAYNNRGLAYHQKGNIDGAIQDFGEAIRLDPGFALAYANRCWAYGLRRRPDEALRDCNESLRQRPDQPNILHSRALAYWLLGDRDKARRDLDRARQINPSFPSWQDRFDRFGRMFWNRFQVRECRF